MARQYLSKWLFWREFLQFYLSFKMNKSSTYLISLLRRLAAWFYDGLIIIAIEMMAAGIVIAILEALVAAG